jgi:hypothetical protein
MDLKEAIASVACQSSGGLTPVQIVEALSHLGIHSSAKKVIETAEKNPRLFSQADGKIYSPPADYRQADERTDMKDMLMTVVCQKTEGLVPLQIVADISRQFGVQTSTKQIMQIIKRYPKLFMEVEGRIASRIDARPW